jgi:hypothetical protein
MNFYPPPPTIKAELHVRIPDELRCVGQETEWRSGFDRPFQQIFLEGPVADDQGNLYVVDIPFGRILRIDADEKVSVIAQWDGEPNGLAATADGDLLVADYKQVRAKASPPFVSLRFFWLIEKSAGHSPMRSKHREDHTEVASPSARAVQGPERSHRGFERQHLLHRSRANQRHGSDWQGLQVVC